MGRRHPWLSWRWQLPHILLSSSLQDIPPLDSSVPIIESVQESPQQSCQPSLLNQLPPAPPSSGMSLVTSLISSTTCTMAWLAAGQFTLSLEPWGHHCLTPHSWRTSSGANRHRGAGDWGVVVAEADLAPAWGVGVLITAVTAGVPAWLKSLVECWFVALVSGALRWRAVFLPVTELTNPLRSPERQNELLV